MPRWTKEAKEKQAELIRQWSPWKESTGPVTAKGKRRSSKNLDRYRKKREILKYAGKQRMGKVLVERIGSPEKIEKFALMREIDSISRKVDKL